jgi:predicted aspartyl protease
LSTHRAAVIALACSAFGCAGAHGGDTSFELVNGHIFVPVTIDGHGPYRFLLDTGANTTIVCAEVARELGLARGSMVMIDGVGTELRGGRPSEVPSIDVGGAEVERVAVLVGASRADTNISGVLGGSFFQHYRVIVDYQRSKVELIAR